MVVLGIVLLGIGVLLLLGGLFLTGVNDTSAEFLGIGIDPSVLFLLGLVAGVAILIGLWTLKFGTKRANVQRKERKRLARLSKRLDEVEQEKAEEAE